MFLNFLPALTVVWRDTTEPMGVSTRQANVMSWTEPSKRSEENGRKNKEPLPEISTNPGI